MKPYLLLDVDGPLNPFRLITKKGYLPPKTSEGESAYSYEKHHLYPRGWANGLPVLLSKEMGADLVSLQDQFDLAWSTTWEREANTLIAPAMGLPEDLPVIEWDLMHPALGWSFPGFWKIPMVLDWLDEREPRPWVFLDDSFGRVDRVRVRDHLGKETESDTPWELKTIHPSQGIRRSDIDYLRSWAAALA